VKEPPPTYNSTFSCGHDKDAVNFSSGNVRA